MSFNPRTDSSSPPGHQDLDASLAAPAQVDQVGGTPTLEQFQRWLQKKVHAASFELNEYSCTFDVVRSARLSHELADYRVVITLLKQFKSEQSA